MSGQATNTPTHTAAPTGALLVMRAETPIHAGAGSGAGEIDLPVQREAHSAWPVIFASSVKGAVRERAEKWAGKDATRLSQIEAAFGKEGSNVSDHAAALAVGEASLLLLPVRSLTTHYKWVTCAAAVERLWRVCMRIGIPNDAVVPKISNPDTACWLSAYGEQIYLEEYAFRRDSFFSILPIASALATITGVLWEDLLSRLVIVHDDRFRWFAEYATPKAAHVALDNDTKTNKGNALWYEETLAPDTVMYAPLTAEKSRSKQTPMSAAQVLAVVTDRIAERPYLRVGGNETLGMGWCHVTACHGGAA